MRTTTLIAGVNPEPAALHEGKVATAHDPADPNGPAEDFVDIAFSLPTDLWEQLKEHSVLTMQTTDEIVNLALREYFDHQADIRTIEETTELMADDIMPLIASASAAAVRDHVVRDGELTVPLKLAVVPSGLSPVFVEERDARFHREVSAICNVDADQYVGDWLHVMVDDSLNGKYDVTSGGIGQDMVDEFNNEDGTPHTAEQKADLFEKIREIAFRYQQEVKSESQPAPAMEGSEA